MFVVGSYHISSEPATPANVLTIEPAPAGLSRIACVPTLPQPTIRLPLAPSASPVGAHDVMPRVPKSIVRRTAPVVLISETPPGLLVPANAGTVMKNVPVFGFHTGCSKPPPAIPPWAAGTVMWPGGLRRVAGAVAGPVVENRFPNAGMSALFAASTRCAVGEYAISSTRKEPPVDIDWSRVGAAGLVALKTLSVLLPSPA